MEAVRIAQARLRQRPLGAAAPRRGPDARRDGPGDGHLRPVDPDSPGSPATAAVAVGVRPAIAPVHRRSVAPLAADTASSDRDPSVVRRARSVGVGVGPLTAIRLEQALDVDRRRLEEDGPSAPSPLTRLDPRREAARAVDVDDAARIHLDRPGGGDSGPRPLRARSRWYLHLEWWHHHRPSHP